MKVLTLLALALLSSMTLAQDKVPTLAGDTVGSVYKCVQPSGKIEYTKTLGPHCTTLFTYRIPRAALQAPVAPATAGASDRTIYKCPRRDGTWAYKAEPLPGCTPLTHYRTPRADLSFRDYPCTLDCSGHEAGYEWAEENDITDPDACGGKSLSFIEGCEAYAREQQDDEDDESNRDDDDDEDEDEDEEEYDD